MGRQRKATTGFYDVDPTYQSPSDVDWGAVEEAAEVQFDKAARAEIVGCVDKRDLARDRYSKGLTEAGLKAALDRMSNAADDLRMLVASAQFRSWRPKDRHCDTAVAMLLTELELDGEDVVEFVSALKKSADKLAGYTKHLEGNVAELASAAKEIDPEVAGLRAFVSAAIAGAVERPARGGGDDAVERERWGFPVGPTSKAFRSFSEKLLKREISESQMKTAFVHVRQCGEKGEMA